MQPHLIHHRRAALGLTIHGPYSRNRRHRCLRAALREAVPTVIATALLLAAASFLTVLFA